MKIWYIGPNSIEHGWPVRDHPDMFFSPVFHAAAEMGPMEKLRFLLLGPGGAKVRAKNRVSCLRGHL
jgi:hypothetical protein